MHDVTILLSTYNGEAYLTQQLDSLLQQTYKNWQLIIRDDGSDDNTINIITQYQQKDSRIQFIPDNAGKLGAFNSFDYLIKHHSGDQYTMFCDQDDIWLPDKIANAVEQAKLHEQSKPFLVHCEVKMVDEQLKLLNPKFINLPNKTIDYFKILVFGNFIPGCSLLVNHCLIEKYLAIPKPCLSYDHWLLLNAAIVGEIMFEKRPGILYRRHQSTVTQANNRGLNYFISRINKKFSEMLKISHSLLQNYSDLSQRKAKFLNAVICLPNKSKRQRLLFCLNEARFPPGIIKKCWYFLWVCLGNEDSSYRK